MEILESLTVLIDFVGHPAMNEDYLNTRRLDSLNKILRKDDNLNIIVSLGGNPKKDWYYKYKYFEKFLELKKIAHNRKNILWIDILDDISINDLSKKLNDLGYTIDPRYTKIMIGGTNLSGCVLKNKQVSISHFAEAGYTVKLILPMCAEGENTGLNDLEKTWKALSIVYKHLKENNLYHNIEFVYENYI